MHGGGYVTYRTCARECQVYYELEEERERLQADDVAILRVEQLCPFPYDLVQRELQRYQGE